MPISTKFLEKLKAKGSKLTYLDFGSAYPMTNDEDIKLLVKMLTENNNLSSIKKIMLNESTISDEGADLLTNFNKLETLSISMNNLTDKGAKSISKIKSLIVLDIAENEITDDGMSEIVNNLRNLKSLTLTSETVSNKTVEAILKHPNLEEVLIFDDENVESAVIDQIKKHTGNNKKENAADKTIIDEKQLEQLADHLKNANISKNQTFFIQQEPVKARENTKAKQENLLKQALEILKSISDPQEQEFFKEDLANSIRRLNPLNNSPECKG